MFKTWKEGISRDPSLLDDAVEYGLSKLGVESIKPEQLSAVCCLLTENTSGRYYTSSSIAHVRPGCAVVVKERESTVYFRRPGRPT